MTPTAVVKWLAGGTDIAIVFGLIGKTLGTVKLYSFCGYCREFAYRE
jgi:hypothetical protein